MNVVNVSEGQELSHPLCFLQVVGIPNGVKQCQIRNISLKTTNSFNTHEDSQSCNALVLLTEGENEIEISCEGSKFVRRVCYRPLHHDKLIRLVYITCLNEERFQGPPNIRTDVNEAVRRIQVGGLVLQTFLAHSLKKEGFGFKTFQLELSSQNLPKVFVIQLPLTLSECYKLSSEKFWEYVALQILSSHIASINCKYLAFFCGTRYSNPHCKTAMTELEVLALTKGHVSLGGGGLALVGTGPLYTWASHIDNVVKGMENNKEVDDSYLMDFSAGRKTWGASYGTHLGSVLHELAHTLDLGHGDSGIMARGFEDFHLFFTSVPAVFPNPNVKIVHQTPTFKAPITFNSDFIPKQACENIRMTVEPSKNPLLACANKLRKRLKGERKNKDNQILEVPFLDVIEPTKPNKSRPLVSELDKNTQNGMNLLGSPYIKYKNSPNLNLLQELYSATTDVTHCSSNESELQTPLKAVWTKSNAALLAFHRWITGNLKESKLELKGSVLISESGIRLIELRDTKMNAFHYWEFVDDSPPSVVHIPWAKVTSWPTETNIEVVALNDCGTLLKQCIQKPL